MRRTDPYRIAHVVGVRPHFMKLASLYHRISQRAEMSQVVIHSGQHYDHNLYGAFLDDFDLPDPDYNLEVVADDQTTQVGSMIEKFGALFTRLNPDMVFVYGDTNTTVAGAIAAAKTNIPLAHVEAGLREFDKSIPEEVNKLLIDAVADLLFCPTATAVEILERGNPVGEVHLVGDVVTDLVLNESDKLDTTVLEQLELKDGEYFFATCHRAVNTGSRSNLYSILEAFAEAHKPVIFAIHPRTKKAVNNHGLDSLLSSANIRVVEPQNFWSTQALIKHAAATITDSGGVIKESYLHQTPCIIIDYQTEWVETVNEGWATIAGPNSAEIASALVNIPKGDAQSMFLGDGNASGQIIVHSLNYLNAKDQTQQK